jgi:hypothetical protein
MHPLMNRTRSEHHFGKVALTVVCWLAPAAALAQGARRTDPTPQDCVSANDKAIAAKHQNKLRAAREQYSICAAASCQVDVRRHCEQQLGDLNRDIPTVVFKLQDKFQERKGELGPVRVTMDGELLTDHLEGLALSVDPGFHSFVFEARGMNPVTKQLDIMQGQKDQQFPVELLSGQLDTHAADVAFDEGKWSQALPLYTQLYRDSRDPIHLRRAAVCRRHLVDSGAENPETAIDTIQQYLDRSSISRDDREWARQYRDDMVALKNGDRTTPGAKRSETANAAASGVPATTVASAAPPTTGGTNPAAVVVPGVPGPYATEAAPSSARRTTLGIAALATGAAFAVAGGVAWKLSNDKYDSLQAACDRGCSASERADGVSAVQTRDRLTVGGFVVGGALIAAGAAALWWPSSGERTSARASLSILPDDRGFLVRGEF